MRIPQFLAKPSEYASAIDSFDLQPDAVPEALSKNDSYFVIGRSHELYPSSLNDLAAPPDALFAFGNPELLRRESHSSRFVGFAGARRASAYGREISYSLANSAATAGDTIVTGMSLGIDGAAARGALQAAGRGIAVLAGGPDDAYPRSHRLLYEQIASAGLVISAAPFGVKTERSLYPTKHNLIAALSDCIVFAEGSRDSRSRDVVVQAESLRRKIFAFPGPVTSPMSYAANDFIARGVATPLVDTDAVPPFTARTTEADNAQPLS